MRIGAHTSVAGGKYKALVRGKELNCESIQIFIRSVRSWASGPLKPKDINSFLEKKEELKDELWPILSHNSYLINLAGTEEEKLQKSMDAMIDELTKAEQLRLDYVNMHPGNKEESEEEKDALERIADNINILFEKTADSDVKIVLETTAGQGNDVGYTFEHMKYLIDHIKNKKRIGVCFDTCHSFAAGYDFSTKKGYDQMWEEFDAIIGLGYLYAFHLNDSLKGAGEKVDRHAHIGEGKIGKEAFGFLLNDARFKDHPGILETPKGEDMYARNLKVLRSLRKNE